MVTIDRDPTAPVGVWFLDEGAGTQVKDATGRWAWYKDAGADHRHPGSITGSSWIQARGGSALHFDGADDVVTIPFPNIDLGGGSYAPFGAFTSYEAWVRAAANPGATRTIVGRGTSCVGSKGPAQGLVTDAAGRLTFVSNAKRSPSVDVWDDTWHHVAGVTDGSTSRLYVDGVEVGGSQSSWNSGSVYEGAPMYVGNYPPCPDSGFAGDISEVRAWNRVLTPQDVAHLARPDTTAPTGTLVVYETIEWVSYEWIRLALTSVEDGPGIAEIQVSNNGVSWDSYYPRRMGDLPWSLEYSAPDGTRTVYARWKDVQGNWSNVVSSEIGLDRVDPVITAMSINSGSAVSVSQTLTIDIAASDELSGLAMLDLYCSPSGGHTPTSSSSYHGPFVPSVTVSVDPYSGPMTCWANVKDKAQNESAGTNRSILVDPSYVPPTPTITRPTATVTSPATPSSEQAVTYTVKFDQYVSGLDATDFSVTGTAVGCAVGAPSGSGSTYTVAVTGCSDGIVSLALGAGSVTDMAGNTGPASAVSGTPVVIDRAAPSTSSISATLRTGATLSGSAIPISLAWQASTDAGGVGLTTSPYQIERSINGGTWTSVGTYAGTGTSVTAATSGNVRYRVRATDRVGNVAPWAYTATLTPRLTQQSSTAVKYGGTWTKASSTSYSGSSTRYAKVRGRSASYKFTGRSIALVTTKSPSRGKAKIYVNGVYQATIDLYRSSTQNRTVAWQKSWSTAGTRTIKVVVAGTNGRPRVDVDAFVVLR